MHRYNAIVSTGIKIVNRIEIPPEMVPDDAKVEITAKVYHGYNAGDAYKDIDEEELKKTVGREYNYRPSSTGETVAGTGESMKADDDKKSDEK